MVRLLRRDGSLIVEYDDCSDVRTAAERAIRDGNSLRCANLVRAYIGGADLRSAYLVGADLVGADLGGADLGGAYIGGADLGGAYIGGAYIGGADLRSADLGGADLGGADLGGADLRGAYLGGAYLVGANLVGAYLAGAQIVSGAVAASVASGDGLMYPWRLWRMEDRSVVLAIGCEEHPLDWWVGAEAAALIARHGGSVDRVSALVDYCRALAPKEEPWVT